MFHLPIVIPKTIAYLCGSILAKLVDGNRKLFFRFALFLKRKAKHRFSLTCERVKNNNFASEAKRNFFYGHLKSSSPGDAFLLYNMYSASAFQIIL